MPASHLEGCLSSCRTDPNNGEIGDLCNQQQTAYTANGTPYTVQLEFSNSAKHCVAPPPTPPPTSASSPFQYSIPRDEQLACYGISVAPNFPSNCRDITNADDQNMCYGMSENSQTPCMSIADTNLKLACYGMSVAPNFPTNCRQHYRPGDAGLLLWCFQRPDNCP